MAGTGYLPKIPNLVTNISQITGYGFQLDRDGAWLLSHLTKGDFNSILGKWVPQFPALLNPDLPNGIFSQGFPLLKLVQNLQVGSQGILNIALGEFGNMLNLRSGFLNNIPISSIMNELGHKSGISLDIGVQGFGSNPALIAKDVMGMLGTRASTINMVFNTATNDGHFHIDVNGPVILGSTSNYDTKIITTDVATGDVVEGSFEFMNGYA